jgi:hypothetical protein
MNRISHGRLTCRANRWGLYGSDDWALLVATVSQATSYKVCPLTCVQIVAACQHIPIFVALKAGFGQSSKVLKQDHISSIDEVSLQTGCIAIFVANQCRRSMQQKCFSFWLIRCRRYPLPYSSGGFSPTTGRSMPSCAGHCWASQSHGVSSLSLCS